MNKKTVKKAGVAMLFSILIFGTFLGSANQQDWYNEHLDYTGPFTHVIDTILYFNSTTGEMLAMNATTGEIWFLKNVNITKDLGVTGNITTQGYFIGDGSQLTNVAGDNMGDVDTETELESTLTDVTNVYTNNDGSLDDDDVTLSDVQIACTNDFHNIGGTDAVDDSVSGSELDGVFSTLGLLRRTGATTYDTITDNSANWNTAYNERGSQIAGNQLNWNGNQLDVQEGSGSGLDADLLDGQDGTYYLDGGNPFNQDLNTTDTPSFENITVGNATVKGNMSNVTMSENTAIFPPMMDGATGFVMPYNKDSYPFRYNTISTESGLKFNHLGYIEFYLGGNKRFSFGLYGTNGGTMETIDPSNNHCNYTAQGISVDNNDKAFYSATYPNAAFYFSTTYHYLLTDASGNTAHYFKLAGDAYHKGGVRIGTDQNNNWIDDSSHGTGSTTMYIGTNTIDTSPPSDMRLKTNLKPTKYGLDSIMKMPVFDFQYTYNKGHWHTGMLAQNMMLVFPDAVEQRSDGYYMIHYPYIIPVLVKGIQQQQQIIDEQQKQIDDLNARLTALEQAVFED